MENYHQLISKTFLSFQTIESTRCEYEKKYHRTKRWWRWWKKYPAILVINRSMLSLACVKADAPSQVRHMFLLLILSFSLFHSHTQKHTHTHRKCFSFVASHDSFFNVQIWCPVKIHEFMSFEALILNLGWKMWMITEAMTISKHSQITWLSEQCLDAYIFFSLSLVKISAKISNFAFSRSTSILHAHRCIFCENILASHKPSEPYKMRTNRCEWAICKQRILFSFNWRKYWEHCAFHMFCLLSVRSDGWCGFLFVFRKIFSKSCNCFRRRFDIYLKS